MTNIVPRPYNKDYEITDAMFGAFRTAGGAKFFFKLAGWATLIFTVIYAVTLPPIMSAYGDIFMVGTYADNDPQLVAGTITSSMVSMVPFLILMSIGAMIAMGILRAAFFRGYFEGDLGGFFPFRLGREEFRQILSMLGFYGMFFAGYIGLIFVIGLLGAAFVGVAGEGGLAVLMLLMIILYFAIFAAFIWYGVTFAPSGALTAKRGKVHVLAARKVTKNRFWALFGSIFVAGFIAYIVYYTLSIVGVMIGVSGLFDPALLSALEGEDASAAISAFGATTKTLGFKIGALFAIAMISFGGAFYALMIARPSAFFVKQWDAADPSRAFE